MTRARTRLGAVIVAMATAMTMASCAPDGGNGSPTSSSTRSGTGAKQPTGPASSAQPAAQLKALEPALITKDVGTLKGNSVSAQVFNMPLAPGLAMSLDVIRNRLLRTRMESHPGTPLTIEQQVLASSSDTVLVAVNAKGAGPLTGSATVVYDGPTNTSYTSAALIAESQWGALTKALAKNAGEHSAAVTKAMGAPQWPYGDGPALALTTGGDLVATFDQAVGAGAITVPADQAKGLLSPLGQRVQQATASPAPYAPGAPGQPGKSSSGSGSPDPSSSTQAGGRPTLVVGPDCSKLKCVALTFDDGPVPETAALLADLTKHKVAASFMVLGTSADADPTMVTTTALSGQHVAAHNQNHNQMSKYSEQKLDQELGQITGTLRKLTGQAPFFLRPPYGDRNKRVDSYVGKYHMVEALWDVDTMDWSVSGKSGAQATILGNLNKEVTNGSIILMHDIHGTSRAAVPAVIAALHDKGYTLVTLTELGPTAQYKYGGRVCRSPRFPISCGW